MRPRKVGYTAKAVRDLAGIRRYIGRDSEAAADAFMADLQRQIVKLAETGITGAPRDEVRPGLRSFPYRNRIIYFRLQGDVLTVVRVVHGRQSNDNLDFD